MPGPRPTRRSPILLLIPLYGLIVFWQALNDLKNTTQNQDFSPIMTFLPCIGIYYMFVKIPAECASAKQMMGSQTPARGIIWYLLGLGAFALILDLNDIAG